MIHAFVFCYGSNFLPCQSEKIDVDGERNSVENTENLGAFGVIFALILYYTAAGWYCSRSSLIDYAICSRVTYFITFWIAFSFCLFIDAHLTTLSLHSDQSCQLSFDTLIFLAR
ncbi:hypothetical protein L6164_011561 [Bauhinia variegata]|uniref:Uncharacterized protein n=1 Tax=Bauhinia variegata TaxID=167791 RepID=A0ACB9P8W9_BAUVA|nr:hypothetical protein L6164_011561 [Bauhinia variegata]